MLTFVLHSSGALNTQNSSLYCTIFQNVTNWHGWWFILGVCVFCRMCNCVFIYYWHSSPLQTLSLHLHSPIFKQFHYSTWTHTTIRPTTVLQFKLQLFLHQWQASISNMRAEIGEDVLIDCMPGWLLHVGVWFGWCWWNLVDFVCIHLPPYLRCGSRVVLHAEGEGIPTIKF